MIPSAALRMSGSRANYSPWPVSPVMRQVGRGKLRHQEEEGWPYASLACATVGGVEGLTGLGARQRLINEL